MNKTSINPLGNYAFSNYKNSLAAKFHPVKSKRFKDENRKIEAEKLGPGWYPLSNGISGKGIYILSTIPSRHCLNISKNARGSTGYTRAQTATPGPGTYSVPSEFGYYSNARIDSIQKNSTVIIPRTQSRHKRENSNGYIREDKKLLLNKSLPSFHTLISKLS